MNTIQKIIAGICILSLPFFSACGKDSTTACNYVTKVQAQADAVNTAAVTYGNDPSTANCIAFKAAYQNYINALQDNSGCVPSGQEAEYQNSIMQAQASLNALQC